MPLKLTKVSFRNNYNPIKLIKIKESFECMDTQVKGIVLKTKEYKDNDKLLTILTLEKGKILVKARGVKKATSKLKAFCQSFCFANFELASTKGTYVLTGVNEIESFYDLTTDISKFSFAFCALELVDKVCYENQEYVSIFIDLLKCLQQMKDGKINVKLLLSKFMLNLLGYEGFNFNLSSCASCGNPLKIECFCDKSKGEILCPNCRTPNHDIMEKVTFSSLKILSQNSYEKLSTIKLSNVVLDKLLKFLTENIYYHYEIKLKSLIL